MPQLAVLAIAAIGVPGLVTAAGALTTLGSIVAGGIGIAASVGAQMFMRQRRQRPPKPQDVSGSIRQSVTARTRHYGRRRRGGAIVFAETENGNYHQVLVLSQGPIDAIEGYYIDDGVFTLGPGVGGGASGWAQEAPHSGRSIYIEARLGDAPQSAFAILTQRFGSIWTADHRLNGVACLHHIQHAVSQEDFSKVYPNRLAQINVLMRGARVLDPRTGATAWSTNLALCLGDYLTHPDGARIPADLMDVASLSAAATVCDELVPTKGGGDLPRYHGSLSYSFEDEPQSVIDRFLLAMDGRLELTEEGKIALHAGAWVEPTVTIDDDAILGYEMRDGTGPFARANEIVVKYEDTANGYVEATADPWRDAASIAVNGRATTTIDAYEIQQHNHARRIAKIIHTRLNPRWQGTVTTDLRGLRAWRQRWIRLRIDDLEVDENVEVTNCELNVDQMTVTLEVSSFSAAAYQFAPETEEGIAPAAPAAAAVTALPAPTALVTGSASRTLGSVVDTVYDPGIEENEEQGRNVTVAVLVASWPTPPRADLAVELQYTRPGLGWIDIPVAPGALSAESGPVARGHVYTLRARHRAVGRGSSDWTVGPAVNIAG